MEVEKSKQKPECMATGIRKARKTKTLSSTYRHKNMKDIARAEDLGGRSDVGEDESVEIDRRVKALQKLVPGGEKMEIEALFEETAGYIAELRGQITVMRSLSDFIDAVAREKRLM